MTLTTLAYSPFHSFDFKAYSVSKAGLNMVGLMYAKQLKESGFKVNLIDPGFRQTNLNGFHSSGGVAAEGALEACRVVADSSKNAPTAKFTAVEGQIRGDGRVGEYWACVWLSSPVAKKYDTTGAYLFTSHSIEYYLTQADGTSMESRVTSV